jgi:hypothetical protein
VADLFQPVSHVDGELWTANSVNRIEQGVESLDVAVDSLEDRVDALGAAGGPGGGSGQVLSGPRSSFSPAIGTILLDTSLTPARYIGGYGTEWRELNGTAITTAGGGGGTPEPGTGSAPVLTSTVTAGGTIGAINLTWTAVSGATSYKVYETESPAGVSGATALTVTNSTRTPSTARNYEYWVTATVNGVESASSNRIQATLPFVAGGGTPPDPGTGGTGSNPSTFLNINGLGNGTGGWWNLGVGLSSGHTDIAPDALKTYVNSPYYTMNSTGAAVSFQIFMNGGKTSTNTKYPRCELREYATGSTTTKASWSGTSGRHIMRGKTRVVHFAPEKPEVSVAQIHDASDDILMLHVTGSSATGAQTWRIKVKGVESGTTLTGVALGQEVSWDFDLNNGALTVKLNGSTAYTGNPGYASSGCYFKAGEYAQQNSTDQSNPATEYGRSELRDLFVSHS